MQKHYWMLYLQTLLKALQFIYTGRMGAGVAKQYYSINRLGKPWPTFALEVFCLSLHSMSNSYLPETLIKHLNKGKVLSPFWRDWKAKCDNVPLNFSGD